VLVYYCEYYLEREREVGRLELCLSLTAASYVTGVASLTLLHHKYALISNEFARLSLVNLTRIRGAARSPVNHLLYDILTSRHLQIFANFLILWFCPMATRHISMVFSNGARVYVRPL
jgi:hypothetical protein